MIAYIQGKDTEIRKYATMSNVSKLAKQQASTQKSISGQGMDRIVGDEAPDTVRGHYLEYLLKRLEGSVAFVEEAAHG